MVMVAVYLVDYVKKSHSIQMSVKFFIMRRVQNCFNESASCRVEEWSRV